MSDKPNYRKSETEPASIGKMTAMMGMAPQIADPVTVATGKAGRIYIECKTKMLRSDGAHDTIRKLIIEAMEETRREVMVEAIRDKAIGNYQKMLDQMPQ